MLRPHVIDYRVHIAQIAAHCALYDWADYAEVSPNLQAKYPVKDIHLGGHFGCCFDGSILNSPPHQITIWQNRININPVKISKVWNCVMARNKRVCH